MWEIASSEPPDQVVRFAEQVGLEMPVLLDQTGEVYAAYVAEGELNAAPYPQEWLIGADGTVRYYANELDVPALTAAIDAALAE